MGLQTYGVALLWARAEDLHGRVALLWGLHAYGVTRLWGCMLMGLQTYGVAHFGFAHLGGCMIMGFARLWGHHNGICTGISHLWGHHNGISHL